MRMNRKPLRVFDKPDTELLYIIGDLHLRAGRPQGRVDDYAAVQEAKLLQVLDPAAKMRAAVLQPGDFFDGIDVPWAVVERYIRLIKERGVKVYCVRGQHDLRYHSRNVENTPLAVMEAAGAVQVVDGAGVALTEDVTLFGCSWGEAEVPVVRGGNDILLVHRMIIEGRTLWPGQTDYVRADKFLKEHRFRLVVSGDNHQHFAADFVDVRGDTRRLVNCGSMMRMAVDQVKHRPVAYLYHIGSQQLTWKPLIVAPVEEVFDMGKMQETIARSDELEEFVRELGAKRDLGLNFLDNLRAVLRDLPKSDAAVRAIVEEALDER